MPQHNNFSSRGNGSQQRVLNVSSELNSESQCASLSNDEIPHWHFDIERVRNDASPLARLLARSMHVGLQASRRALIRGCCDSRFSISIGLLLMNIEVE